MGVGRMAGPSGSATTRGGGVFPALGWRASRREAQDDRVDGRPGAARSEGAPTVGQVVLRAFRDDDVALAAELATDPYLTLLWPLAPDPTVEQAREWVDRQRERAASGRGVSFAVAEAPGGPGLGQVGLSLRDLDQGRGIAGYAVAPSARGRGVATAALRALTRFAWTIRALHRVELYIEPWNVPSVRVAERAGYAREGLLRSHQEIGGRRRDMLLYAAVRDPGPGAGPPDRE